MNWQIYAFCGKAWYSRAIQFRTWSEFSHVAIGSDGTFWEATTPKVRKLSFEDFWKEYEEIPCAVLRFKHAPFLLSEDLKLESFLDLHVGEKYDTVNLLRFLFADDKEKKDKRWICSEFIVAASRAIGQDIQSRVDAYKMTPAEVYMSPVLELSGFGMMKQGKWASLNIKDYVKTID